MNNTSDDLDENPKNAKMLQTMRIIWMILIAVFAAVVLWRLYDWSNGQDNLRGVLSPLGMIFVGAGALIRPRNKMLSYIFTGIAMILVISGLVLLFIY